MGLLDNISGTVSNIVGGGTDSTGGIMEGVMSLLGNASGGGLAGIVRGFQDKGLGDLVSSWIGSGENAPITTQQVTEGLGEDTVRQFADRTGLSTEDATSKLTELLPSVIDKLTPDGIIPDGNMLEQGMAFLKNKLG